MTARYGIRPPDLPGVPSFSAGARIMHGWEVPDGWEYRTRDIAAWGTGYTGTDYLVEARPPQPATETIPVADALGRTLPDGRKITTVHVVPWAGNEQLDAYDSTDTIEVRT